MCFYYCGYPIWISLWILTILHNVSSSVQVQIRFMEYIHSSSQINPSYDLRLFSFIYFLITPFKDAHSEILARTAPNMYDVLIAFFWGLVGVIAVTRVEKGNPIPGVAIATALMPPLCTAGFGLATGKFKFFAGAMFLYIINCVFICIATFIIVKFLKYLSAKFVDKK